MTMGYTDGIVQSHYTNPSLLNIATSTDWKELLYDYMGAESDDPILDEI